SMDERDKLFQQTVSFIAAVHQVHYDMTKTMPLHGLTALQYEIMEFIAIDQPLTPSQISECKGISMPNTSRELRKLTEKGLCERFDDPTDRRKQYIRLSELGEKYMAEAFEHMKQELGKRLGDMGENELQHIIASMQHLQKTVFYSE